MVLYWCCIDDIIIGVILVADILTKFTIIFNKFFVDICKIVDWMLFDFVWKNRTHYIRKSVVMNTYENGKSLFFKYNQQSNITCMN